MTASGMGAPCGCGVTPMLPPRRGLSGPRTTHVAGPVSRRGVSGEATGGARAPAAQLGERAARARRCGRTARAPATSVPGRATAWAAALRDRLDPAGGERAGRAGAGAQAERVQAGRQHRLRPPRRSRPRTGGTGPRRTARGAVMNSGPSRSPSDTVRPPARDDGDRLRRAIAGDSVPGVGAQRLGERPDRAQVGAGADDDLGAQLAQPVHGVARGSGTATVGFDPLGDVVGADHDDREVGPGPAERVDLRGEVGATRRRRRRRWSGAPAGGRPRRCRSRAARPGCRGRGRRRSRPRSSRRASRCGSAAGVRLDAGGGPDRVVAIRRRSPWRPGNAALGQLDLARTMQRRARAADAGAPRARAPSAAAARMHATDCGRLRRECRTRRVTRSALARTTDRTER